MKDFNSNKDGKRPSASFVVGAVALLFLIVGYQAALFIHKASVARIIANHDEPDTVFVYASDNANQAAGITVSETPVGSAGSATGQTSDRYPGVSARSTAYRSDGLSSVAESAEASYRAETFRKKSEHSIHAEQIRRNCSPRRYESFHFDPNTVSVDDLMRLGFSQKQAQSIDNYRQKGGRFRRKSDFAKSYVVEDSVFRRLEKYIDIPKIDINSADSVVFLSLPGIGKFFAGKMVSFRKELGGYSYPEQLLDIWHFDQEKFDNLKDLIKLDTLGIPPYSLWTFPEKTLALHPYIGKRAARSIVLFRENSPKSDWTVANLQKAGILAPDKASKLARCRIAKP